VIAALEDAKDAAAGRTKRLRTTVTAAPQSVRKASVTVRRAPFTTTKGNNEQKGVSTKNTQASAKPSTTHRMATRSRNKPARPAPVQSDGSDDDDEEGNEDENEDVETEDIEMLDASAGASDNPAAPVANMVSTGSRSRPSLGSAYVITQIDKGFITDLPAAVTLMAIPLFSTRKMVQSGSPTQNLSITSRLQFMT